MTHDPVNHPSHYTEGRAFEVIEVLEDWCERAPSVIKGSLQWQVLKYLGRVWDKKNPLEDLKKSRWYLDRLITELEADEAAERLVSESRKEANGSRDVSYQDILEDAAYEAAQGEELVMEYGVRDVEGIAVCHLAKELNLSEHAILDLCERLSRPVNSWASIVDNETAQMIREQAAFDVDDAPLDYWDHEVN